MGAVRNVGAGKPEPRYPPDIPVTRFTVETLLAFTVIPLG